MTTEQQHDVTAELNEAMAGAFETGNFEGVAPFFVEGASLLPPRGGVVKGRAAITAFWLGVRNRFASVTFTTVETKSVAEAVRRENGTFVMRPAAQDGVAAEGKYLFVWLLVDGEWQIDSGIWNRNADAGAGRQQQAGGRSGAQQGGGGGRQGGGRQGGGRPGAGGGGQGGGQGAYRQQGGGRRPIGGRQGGGAGVGPQGRQGGGRQGGGQQGGSLYNQNGGLYSNLDD